MGKHFKTSFPTLIYETCKVISFVVADDQFVCRRFNHLGAFVEVDDTKCCIGDMSYRFIHV